MALAVRHLWSASDYWSRSISIHSTGLIDDSVSKARIFSGEEVRCKSVVPRIVIKVLDSARWLAPLVVTATLFGFVSSGEVAAAQVSSTSLVSFDFSTPSAGYGVFTRESLSGDLCRDYVGRTVDGGALFKDPVPVYSWNCSKDNFSSSLASDGRGDVFLYGPQLFVSHDDARTWTRVPQPGPILDVEAQGASVWLVESDCKPGVPVAGYCSIGLERSANGGRTWSSLPTPPGAETGYRMPTPGQSFLTRTSQSTAYLMLEPRAPFGSSSTAVPFWTTTDGGKTWSDRHVTCPMDALHVVYSVAPDGVIMVVCASEPSAGSQLKSVIESSDQGATWTVDSMSDEHRLSDLDSGYMGSIHLVSNEKAFLVGGRSSLLETRDAGKVWAALQPLIGSTAGGTSQVEFFNSSDGLVLGNDDSRNERLTLWRTVDGGESWTTVVPRMASQ